jgi:Zn-finger nucleic acid-binding protein
MQDGRVENEPIQFCSRCRGFLATNPAFAAIVRARRAKRPVGDNSHSFSPDELHRRVDCPKCRQRMDTHPFYGGGRVVVDTCASCALIWLDAGELTVIEQHNPAPLPSLPPPAPRTSASTANADADDALAALANWLIVPW